jgi:hypothetical protein
MLLLLHLQIYVARIICVNLWKSNDGDADYPTRVSNEGEESVLFEWITDHFPLLICNQNCITYFSVIRNTNLMIFF